MLAVIAPMGMMSGAIWCNLHGWYLMSFFSGTFCWRIYSTSKYYISIGKEGVGR